MELMKGPFGEDLYFKKTGVLKLLKKKDSIFFIDDYFRSYFKLKDQKNIIFVKAGESLKSLSALEKHLNFLVKGGATKKTTIVAIGGGSVGDSIGFLASVYLRGVDFIQVPTTWLAAVDSSVGGKTALNLKGYKNQVGSIKAPKSIYFFEDLLRSSPAAKSEGEVLKTLILNHHKAWAKKELKNWSGQMPPKDLLFKLVEFKKNIVKKDIEDTKGVRAVLNLGHTVGHALELLLGISHSEAVKLGTKFSLNWSLKKKFLKLGKFNELMTPFSESLPQVNIKSLENALMHDKKIGDKERLNFIFVEDKGGTGKLVKVLDIVNEYKRQVSCGL